MHKHAGRFVILILGWAALIPLTSHAADYYVAPDGDDANPGTLAAPWRHIAYATCGGSYGCPIATSNPNKLKAGDTLYLRAGTYVENRIRFASSGLPGQPITVASHSGESATIDGGLDTTLVGQSAIGVFYIDGRSHIVIDGLTIMRGWRANIHLGENATTSDITIQNCTLRDLNAWDNAGHIQLYNNAIRILIRNNVFHGFASPQDAPPIYACAVWVGYTGGYTIENNEMYDLGKGVFAKYRNQNGFNPIIRNNLIYNISDDAISLNCNRALVENNVVIGVGNNGVRFAQDSGCEINGGGDNTVVHNTIVGAVRGVRVHWSASSCNTGRNNTLRDNVIVGFSNSEHRGVSIWPYAVPAFGGTGVDDSNTTLDHNLVYSDAFPQPIRVLGQYYDVASAPLAGSGNIQQAPVFVDAANGDYTIAAASPGKNAASDGADMGARICAVGPNPTCAGFGDSVAPAAPMNLTVQ